MVSPVTRWRGMALVLAGALAAAPLAARASAHDRGLVILLSKFGNDPTPGQLAAYGPGLQSKLFSIADDPTVPTLARVRAVACAARAGTPAAFDLAAGLATSKTALRRLRLAGVWSLQHHFRAWPETVTVLSHVLVDPDPGLRAAAVRALSAVGTPRALKLLAVRRIAERNSVVRLALRRALVRRLPPGTVLPRDGRVRRPVLLVRPTPGKGGRR